MRPVLLMPLLMPMLAACMQAQPAATTDPRPRQEAACTAAIAAHIRRPEAEITSRWRSASEGVASVEARDGNRLHLCRVDAAGRVLGYSHPGA